jgi:hypothetical protein
VTNKSEALFGAGDLQLAPPTVPSRHVGDASGTRHDGGVAKPPSQPSSYGPLAGQRT